MDKFKKIKETNKLLFDELKNIVMKYTDKP